MALAASLDPTVVLNVAVSPAQLTLTDATGNYDSGTNPGGYGAPNPERADLFVLLFAFDATSLPTLTPVPMAGYGLAEVSADGTYRGYIIAVTTIAPTTGDLAGYVFYDTADDTVKQTVVDDSAAGATTLLVNVGLETSPPSSATIDTLTAALPDVGLWSFTDFVVVIPIPPAPVQLKIERTAWVTNSLGAVTGFKVTNITGAYNVTTNSGGFGTPNMERSDVWIALFASAYDASTSPPSLTALPVSNYDGTTDDEYTVALSGDAIIVVHAFALPTTAPIGSIPVGSQWYDLAENAFMQTVSVNTIVGAIVVLDLDTALLGDAHGDVEIHDRSIQVATQIVTEKYADTECGCNCEDPAWKDYLRLYAWLNSGVVGNFTITDFFGAAKTLDAINAEN